MIVDLFAGPGGWDEGLRSIGITDVVGLEWDDAACRTRAAAGHRTIRCDVAEYPTAPFVGKVRGLIASPPCQAWSMAGKGAGRKEVDRVHAAVELCRSGWTDEALAGPWSDPRTALILQPLRWAWDLRPQWIACEQVPPALDVWKHVADVFRSWGYSADARVLCAADYGVPQTRDRAFLIASRVPLAWPEPTHAEKPEPSLFGPSRKPWVTIAGALGVPRWAVIRHNQAWQGRPRDENGVARVRAADGTDYYFRIHAAGPCWVINSNTGSWRWENLHGGERPVTLAEACVLSGLPSDYPFTGNAGKQFEQVGNIVCPPVAAALIGALNCSPEKRSEAAA